MNVFFLHLILSLGETQKVPKRFLNKEAYLLNLSDFICRKSIKFDKGKLGVSIDKLTVDTNFVIVRNIHLEIM